MSATANGTDPANAPQADPGKDPTDETPTVEQLQAQLDEWKGHARKHEDAAKANKDAAKELAALKRAALTDAERADAEKAETAQAIKDAIERAEKAEAALIRRTIAVDLELSAEDVAVLDGVQGDEKTLRALAERLAGRKSPGPKPNKSQGKTEATSAHPRDAFVAALEDLF